MTKQDLIDQLKRLAMGRLDACEAIADILMPDGCEFCVMPGGQHFGPCPNNPEPTFDVALPTDKLIEAVEAQHAKKKAK